MIPGTKIRLGTLDYILPPLTIGQLRNGLMEKIEEHDKLVESGAGMKLFFIREEIILSALRRNYPDITAEAAELDLHNINEAWSAVTGLTFGNDTSVDSVPLAGDTTSGLSTAP